MRSCGNPTEQSLKFPSIIGTLGSTRLIESLDAGPLIGVSVT